MAIIQKVLVAQMIGAMVELIFAPRKQNQWEKCSTKLARRSRGVVIIL